jgi:hypothetical protein
MVHFITKLYMDEIATKPLETFKEAKIVRCWKRFKESRKVHKKRYFFGTCLLKLGAFTAFLVVSGLKFDKFFQRPKYVAVCQYVVSDELDLVVDESNCYIEVDEKHFTCDQEYGGNPTGETYEEESGDYSYDNGDTSYDSGDTNYDGGDTSYDDGDTSNDSGDTSYDSGDTSYDNGDTSNDNGDTSYDSGDTSYDNGDTSYDGGDTGDTGSTEDNTDIPDQDSSSESDSAIPPSRTIRRALRSIRYLQYDYSGSDTDSDPESDPYLSSNDADSAAEFANDIKKGYLVLLYLVWILFNIGFRIRSNLYTYRSRILQTIPCYTTTKKLKIALYENLIDICVATALYPFTYPDYGDCFECKSTFMCNISTYVMVNIGFYVVFISIILTMFDNTRRMYIEFLRSVYEYVKCKSGRKNSGIRCCVRYLICLIVVCINFFAIVACIISIVDYISTVYSLIQLFISIFFYFALFIDGDARKNQVAPAEQKNLTQNNDNGVETGIVIYRQNDPIPTDEHPEQLFTVRANKDPTIEETHPKNVDYPKYELVTQRPNNEPPQDRPDDQRAIQEPPNRNNPRMNILKRIVKFATIFWRCASNN